MIKIVICISLLIFTWCIFLFDKIKNKRQYKKINFESLAFYTSCFLLCLLFCSPEYKSVTALVISVFMTMTVLYYLFKEIIFPIFLAIVIAPLYYEKSCAYYSKKDYKKALDKINIAIYLFNKPEHKAYCYNLKALIFHELSNDTEAIKYFLKAIKNNKKMKTISPKILGLYYYNLSQSYEAIGNLNLKEKSLYIANELGYKQEA